MKRLQFKSIYFHTQLDYELMLEWLDSIESVDDYIIEGNDLTLTLKAQVPNEDLLELVALSDRYGLDVTAFKEYMHADNAYWCSGPKFQVIFPQTNKEQKQQIDADPSFVCLECTPVSLYTELDKNNMFEWMERNASFATIVGLGTVTSLYLSKEAINDESLKNLVGLFKRYNFNIQQLNVFLNDYNKEWLQALIQY